MAARIPLPRYSALPEWVMLHREDPRDDRVVIQVPNADRSDAATYVLMLDRPADVAWLEGLPGYRTLRGMLDVEQHVAYSPASGDAVPVADLDAPGPFAEVFAAACAEGSHAPPGIMERLTMRRRQRTMPRVEPTPLRAALLGARRAGRWGSQ